MICIFWVSESYVPRKNKYLSVCGEKLLLEVPKLCLISLS